MKKTQKKARRRSGVLLHITSLPSPYGIGTVGRQAREFVDFLAEAGQSFWQILPLCPTSYGDSPYQSFSTFAGNTYLIDPDRLIEDGLLEKAECEALEWGSDPLAVDFGLMYESRNILLRKACGRLLTAPPEDYADFCKAEADWLEDYALFMAIKYDNGGVSWTEWPEELRRRESAAMEEAKERLAADVDFHKAAQYLFFRQWTELKQYANERGVEIIGDLPIYVAMDSADVWASPGLFMLDEDLIPIEVAGCPPDCFTADGQLWGNPLYNWEAMKNQRYRWWVRRIASCERLYDVTRIDHFRGFAGYYCIPYGMDNARIGQWREGPGIELFRVIKAELGERRIIAEDLGFLDDSVRKLLRQSGYPGMKVLQFAFDADGDSDYLPHHYPRNCIVYTGTHDNDTTLGWAAHARRKDVRFAKQYTRAGRALPLNWAMICTALSSVADTVITPMQDILGLGSEARMNTPSTLGCNWQWRMSADVCTPELAAKLRKYCEIYRRD
ncbi:MAG: 4-alpha-glucanotransferase [Ruminococcaceae bacterium]|nr:4-alpha-glucanotransferase [Oscillospiraceae bacterium]